MDVIERISIPIDTSSDEDMLSLIKTSIGTKFVVRWSDLMCKLALQAVRTVTQDDAGVKTVDIKRYARVEKVPGGGGTLRIIDSTTFPAAKTIAASVVTLQPGGLRELHWHPNVRSRSSFLCMTRKI